MSETTPLERVERLQEVLHAVRREIGKKVVGQQAVIDDLLACFLAGGHCILIGVPGLAKTMLIQSLAQSLNLEFNRIQFTPDLMPSDITGSEILVEDRTAGVRTFQFVKGPVFSNLVLADEINRTPPKTQSALLQAMQERTVTSAGKTFSLPDPFWVMATQNPVEQEGTYPLPEAQQDRFMFSLTIDYPSVAEERTIARLAPGDYTEEIRPVVDADELNAFRALVHEVPVADSVVNAAVALVRATRPGTDRCPESVAELITWGAGPRASQFLVTAARAYALLDNRTTPDVADVHRAAPPVLRHRLVRSFHAEIEKISTDDIITRIINDIT